MNIAVIGSGAAAYGVLLKLKKLIKDTNTKVTILSKNLNYMNNIFLENTNVDKNKISSSLSKNIYSQIRHNFGYSFNEIKVENCSKLIYEFPYAGGLSDFWSCSAALPLIQDLNNWGNKFFSGINFKSNLVGKSKSKE